MLSSMTDHLQFCNNNGVVKICDPHSTFSKIYGFVDVKDIIMSFDKDALSFVGCHVGGILEVAHNMHQLRFSIFFLQISI